MRRLHLDAFAGISGDMFLGALMDLGLPPDDLNADLRRLRLAGLSVSRRRVRRGALTGTRALVRVPDRHHPHRGPDEIRRVLTRAKLPEPVRRNALDVFERLGRVEARLHGVPPTRIHFHEVGALDAIADVVGVCAGLHRLRIGEIRVSPVNVGSGVIRSAHGMLPVPAPATLELLRGFELVSEGPAAEHTTPTGAALLSVLARPAAGGKTPLRLEAVGYGAGERRWPDFPNLLRARLYGPDGTAGEEWNEDCVAVLTANVDDLSPQIMAYACERLLAAGALDVSLQPIYMKKNRPGERIEVICRPELVDELARILFRETATLGIRIAYHQRLILERRWQTVAVQGRRVRVKLGFLGSARVTASPEFEDAKICAHQTGRPLAEILEAARHKARTRT